MAEELRCRICLKRVTRHGSSWLDDDGVAKCEKGYNHDPHDGHGWSAPTDSDSVGALHGPLDRRYWPEKPSR